jgi:hypothetical protein
MFFPSSKPEHHSAGTRKKIENYSYALLDKIGKGYSSTVYKGRNDDTSKSLDISSLF